jgi:hypothetical protein
MSRDPGDEDGRSRLVGVTFVWPYAGTAVLVTGSFFNWCNTIPLHRRNSDSSTPTTTIAPEDVFSTVLYLPPGKHLYKFIVDGVWHYAPHQPVVTDEVGNLNNWIIVKNLGI